jgi:hypothetical protein
MPDFGIFRGFNDKLFGDKLYAGQLPIHLGMVESDFFAGLLDFYPNAAAAYSLRRLRGAYTGNAIEVRRTNNDVADIGFNGLGELDTTALLAFTGTGALDNGFITKWYDQSGNGNNATQITAINQPQIVSSGSVILENGQPAVQFDGINDFLTTSISISTNLIAIINVFRTIVNSGNLRAFQLGDLNAISKSIYMSNDFQFNLAQTAGYRHPENEPVSGNAPNTNQNLFFYQRLSTSRQELVVNNGTTFFNNNTTTTFTSDVLNIGSQNSTLSFLNGRINELVIYPFNQSSNRTGIQENINNFYSIY